MRRETNKVYTKGNIVNIKVLLNQSYVFAEDRYGLFESFKAVIVE